MTTSAKLVREARDAIRTKHTISQIQPLVQSSLPWHLRVTVVPPSYLPWATDCSDIMGEANKETVPSVAIFLQDLCYKHQFIRSRDLSAIVERPERLRAVTMGLSAAIARLETLSTPIPQRRSHETHTAPTEEFHDPSDVEQLVGVMGQMKLEPEHPVQSTPVAIVQSHASVALLTHPAVKYVHGDIDGDVYLRKLKGWIADSGNKIRDGNSEIPDGLSQGDLYLCPESIHALEGAVGTVCEAVDRVIISSRPESPPSDTSTTISYNLPTHRAFVAVRPPGHHCGEDTPSGFCFLNNVAIGAAHAHLKHGINRVVILDIDLHHGNGTQSIIWQINEEAYRQSLEVEAGAQPSQQPGLKVYYGSVHDILSFPCEDGKAELVQAASVSLHQSHGQYIENVHLETYESEKDFWEVLYKQQYSRILRKAEDFIEHTGGPGDDVIVFISCGMDACEHEYKSMSRHNRKVPASFYYRFTQDACALSCRYAKGRVVSVLEGGYSDRALTSGTMAHLSGLIDEKQLVGKIDEDWWSVENLEKLEKATRKRRGDRVFPGGFEGFDQWLKRTIEIFQSLNPSMKISSSSSSSLAPLTSMKLRERKSKSADTSPVRSTGLLPKVDMSRSDSVASIATSLGEGEGDSQAAALKKKLPRVILRLGPDPNNSSG